MNDLQVTTLESELAGSYAQPVSFGKNVKRLRKARGLQAQELAEQLGVKGGTLSDWERDRRGLPEGPTLIRFAKVLGCSVEELLVGVDPAYDEIVIERRDLPDHEVKGMSKPHKGGSIAPASAASSRIQQLEQQLRDRNRFIEQVEDAALKMFRLFTPSKENRGTRAHEPGRRGAGRKAG